MKTGIALVVLFLVSLAVVGSNGQNTPKPTKRPRPTKQPKTPRPSSLTNVTTTVKEIDGKLQITVDFEYSGSDVCKCDVAATKPRKMVFAKISQCVECFTLTVKEGTFKIDIKCKRGRSSTTIVVPKSIRCGPVPKIPNGSVDLSGRTIGSTATYTCDDGYTIRGEGTRTCQCDGTWSGMEPVCAFSKKKMCDSLNSISEALLNTANTGSCTISNNCLTMSCTGARNFGPLPNVNFENSFQLHPCANPPAVTIRVATMGTVIFDQKISDTTTVSGTASGIPFSLTINIVQMPSAMVLMGEITILGQTIPIVEGGNGTTICFSADCDCGHPGLIDNGEVDVSDGTETGDKATYTCNEGYDMVGEMTRTCEDTGMWGGRAPWCTVPFDDTCATLKTSAIAGIDTVTTSTCTVSDDCSTAECEDFTNIGQGNTVYSTSEIRLGTCQSEPSLWLRLGRNSEPFVLYPCDSFTFSNVNLDNQRVTTSVSMEEAPTGFSYTWRQSVGGNSTTISQIVPTFCLCDQLPDIDCGTVNRPTTPTVGSITTYSCDGAFRLVGDTERTCMPSGEWSGDEPRCSTSWEAMCMTAQESFEAALAQRFLSGSCSLSTDCLTSTCELSAAVGLLVADIRMTTSALSCSKPYGAVIRSDSARLGDVFSGTFTESTEIMVQVDALVIFININIMQMDKGISLEVTLSFRGSPTVFTLFPRKKLIMHCICPEPEGIKNGGVTLSAGYEVESLAIYYCNKNFELEGPQVRTCQPNGTWSGTAPVCKPLNKKPMCDSMKATADSALASPMISGSCNTSDDCTATKCSITATINGGGMLSITSRITYYPCDKPYSIRYEIAIQPLNIKVDQTTSDDITIPIGEGNQIQFTASQGQYCVEVAATAQFGEMTFPVIPRTTVDLYC